MCGCVSGGSVIIVERPVPLVGLSPVFLGPSTDTSLCPLSELDQQDGHKEQSSMTGTDPSAVAGVKVRARDTSWVPLPLAIHTWIASYNCRQHVGVMVTDT